MLAKIESEFFVGLDLGQPHELMAAAVLEKIYAWNGPNEYVSHSAVRHLERFSPGTAYATMAVRLVMKFEESPLAGAMLVVDQTMVGKPVMDLFRDAGTLHGAQMHVLEAHVLMLGAPVSVG
jgi:hypothetical protein